MFVMPRATLRFTSAILIAASLLAGARPAPAAEIQGAEGRYRIPLTMARTAHIAPDLGPNHIEFDFPPTHIGFAWKGAEATAVRYRYYDVFGIPSEWMRARPDLDASDGRRRYTGVIGVPRPVAIDWAPVGDTGTVTIDYLNTEDGPTRVVEVPAAQRTAPAATNEPRIITRRQWGADEGMTPRSGSCTRRFFKVQQLFVHHTVGSNYDSNPEASMRAIQWYHIRRQGWCDVGYNFVIGWDGRIFEGRWARNYARFEPHDSENRAGRAVAGAHVANYNSGSVGISMMGNFMSTHPPVAMRESLVRLLAWEADRHGLRPKGKHTYKNPETGLRRRLKFISGHRDAGQTACPGNTLYAELPAVRRQVASFIGSGLEASKIEVTPSAPKTTYGTSVTFTGTVRGEAGQGLGGKKVLLYRKNPGTAWFAMDPISTRSDGTFSFDLVPQRNVTVAAVFQGDATTWGSQSRPVKVRVQPALTLRAEGGTADPLGTVHYPPETTTIQFAGDMQPLHPNAVLTLRFFEVATDGSETHYIKVPVTPTAEGTYGYTFTLPEGAAGRSFRAVTWFKGDNDHAAGRSNSVTFTIDPL